MGDCLACGRGIVFYSSANNKMYLLHNKKEIVMAHLIDKDALVAEIEKLIDEIYAGRPFDSLSSEQQTALWYVKSTMSSVNTLEVKEVSTNIPNIDDLLEEDGIDPDSKEAKIFKENYYSALEKLKEKIV